MILVVCALVLVAGSVLGNQPAKCGSAFADVYRAFAPLAVLHRSYADYLFYGTDIVIPDALLSACDETGRLLATLNLDLMSQTGSEVAATMPWLARVRADVAMFCEEYRQVLSSIAGLGSPDIALMKEASDLGLFAEIYHLQEGLATAFDAYLDGLNDEQSTWAFGAAFALRTVLDQLPLERIEPNLRTILYGSDQAVAPPAFIPSDIADVIDNLVSFVDVPVDADELAFVEHWAQDIYQYVIEMP